jgi:hypothetical protein
MMKRISELYLRWKENRRVPTRGQTMTEYAFILAAVALVVFVFYETMGQSINQMVAWGTVHNDLLTSS